MASAAIRQQGSKPDRAQARRLRSAIVLKNEGDVILNNVSLGKSFGGCLHNERLRSSGAKSGLLHLLARGVCC
jgi:hypothetical protein